MVTVTVSSAAVTVISTVGDSRSWWTIAFRTSSSIARSIHVVADAWTVPSGVDTVTDASGNASAISAATASTARATSTGSVSGGSLNTSVIWWTFSLVDSSASARAAMSAAPAATESTSPAAAPRPRLPHALPLCRLSAAPGRGRRSSRSGGCAGGRGLRPEAGARDSRCPSRRGGLRRRRRRGCLPYPALPAGSTARRTFVSRGRDASASRGTPLTALRVLESSAAARPDSCRHRRHRPV